MPHHAVSLDVTSTGALRSAQAHGLHLLLHPASELEDGLGGLWLRVRGDEDGEGDVWTPYPLVGTGSTGTGVRAEGDARTRSGALPDRALTWSWRLAPLVGGAGWTWQVLVRNTGDAPLEVDLLHVQDCALSPAAVLEANRLYPSQYLDLTPVDLGARGPGVAVRQNMPGPTAPWALVGCLGRAVSWATDGLQLRGRGLPEGAPWPGLRGDLPGVRLQHEHAAAALQSEPRLLGPGEQWASGFFTVVLEDHPGATTDADAAVLDGLDLGLPTPDRPAVAEERPTARNLLDTSAPLLPRELTAEEVDGLVGGGRHHVEVLDGREVSWFTAGGGHVVTAAKQAAVLRPHGQVLRSLRRLLPDESDVTSTVWMDGTFCSHLTRGHVALGRVLSAREDLLAIARLRGLRIAIDLGEGWQLLGTPSLWLDEVDEATWWYALADRTLRVTAHAPTADGRCRVQVDTLEGDPVPALVVLHLDWSGAPGMVGDVVTRGSVVEVTAPSGATLGALGVTVATDVGTGGRAAAVEVSDDGALFSDGASRGEPVLTLRVHPSPSWSLELQARARAGTAPQTGPTEESTTDLWAGVHDVVSLAAEAPGRRRDALERLGRVTGWYAHDAVIHYLSPRGLEQHTGGKWGTRDVCQGPVGLLRSWARHDEWRALLLLILRGQQDRGDWPQAFDFLASHRVDAVEDAHGDVVYWPLLAVGQYLHATGDLSVLDEEVGFTGDGSPGGTASVDEHLRRALDVVDSTFLQGTSLPAYGHGDWNDSLQPADPDLARRMVSTWTAVLQVEALSRLAEGLGTAYPDLADRARGLAAGAARDVELHLMVDGVLAGYGVAGTEGKLEPMIHPRDSRTGLTYSLLPMIHAIAGDLLSPEAARAHLDVIERHLLGPDGARLFDRPVAYRGGPTEVFQRAEASSFFGREVGIMYMHAHLRYAEALARVGDGAGVLDALARAVPVGLQDLVPSAAPRQANTYSSSSDAAFPDRYAASDRYAEALAGEVPLEAGWRVYSSGPGLFLEILTQRMLGLRHAGHELEIDPVVDPSLGTVRASVPLAGGRVVELEIVCGTAGHGVAEVSVDGRTMEVRALDNPYRAAGVAVRVDDLGAGSGPVRLRVVTR
ncbi:GH36-type glycosyl hydrolase domain-containing protein [Ornithinimicrobium tianjinense]|nr:cellobiose phosphorylase [Ornithinimicrobium tianjinense]